MPLYTMQLQGRIILEMPDDFDIATFNDFNKDGNADIGLNIGVSYDRGMVAFSLKCKDIEKTDEPMSLEVMNALIDLPHDNSLNEYHETWLSKFGGVRDVEIDTLINETRDRWKTRNEFYEENQRLQEPSSENISTYQLHLMFDAIALKTKVSTLNEEMNELKILHTINCTDLHVYNQIKSDLIALLEPYKYDSTWFEIPQTDLDVIISQFIEDNNLLGL